MPIDLLDRGEFGGVLGGQERHRQVVLGEFRGDLAVPESAPVTDESSDEVQKAVEVPASRSLGGAEQ